MRYRIPGLMATAVVMTGLVFTLHAQDPGPPGGREGRFPNFPPMPLMVALDTDGDGELSEKEIAAASTSLKKLDKDKNGKLSAAELRPEFGPGGMMGGGGNPAEVVTRLLAFDKDKDGKLTREELPERMRTLMDRADTNKDGILDKDELTKYAEQQARRGGGGPGGRGRGGEGPEGRPRPPSNDQ